jgi:type IV pilus assembly protein PilB
LFLILNTLYAGKNYFLCLYAFECGNRNTVNDIMIQSLGSILRKYSNLDEDYLEISVSSSAKQGLRIGDYLVSMGIAESLVYRSLAEQFKMEFADNIESMISMDLLRELPSELFRDGRCFPVEMNEIVLRIVIADPLDLDIIAMTESASGLVIDTVLTTPSEMNRIKKKLFEGDTMFKQSAGKIAREYESQLNKEESLSIEEIRERTESEPVVKMADLIFREAIKLNASDIHIEPTEYNAIVRFRIDGMLRQHTEVSKWMYSPLTSRIKILSDLDIAEKRVPQDGRIRYSLDNNTFDFRVSTLPTHFGEKTVIRVLKHDHNLLDLKNIGISESDMVKISELIEKPQGMVFVTGPTGSGKSSTLFACLNRIRNKAINITTIENPIEYKLDGVNQVQINEKAGVTFATTLRSLLRQDPDVILVGEIRDAETAQIAIQASQTGHLVLSTLHTNDALSAITRLRDLGIPGFLISSSILAVVAQRLLRKLCPFCKKESDVPEEIKQKWQALLAGYPMPKTFSSIGCEKCNNSGYKGRIGIFEMIVVDETLRSLIADNATETQIRKLLRENGTKTLIQDGISKIEQGVTTPEELLRVVLVEDVIQMQSASVAPDSSDIG